jgi:hypothetical protein
MMVDVGAGVAVAAAADVVAVEVVAEVRNRYLRLT